MLPSLTGAEVLQHRNEGRLRYLRKLENQLREHPGDEFARRLAADLDRRSPLSREPASASASAPSPAGGGGAVAAAAAAGGAAPPPRETMEEDNAGAVPQGAAAALARSTLPASSSRSAYAANGGTDALVAQLERTATAMPGFGGTATEFLEHDRADRAGQLAREQMDVVELQQVNGPGSASAAGTWGDRRGLRGRGGRSLPELGAGAPVSSRSWAGVGAAARLEFERRVNVYVTAPFTAAARVTRVITAP